MQHTNASFKVVPGRPIRPVFHHLIQVYAFSLHISRCIFHIHFKQFLNTYRADFARNQLLHTDAAIAAWVADNGYTFDGPTFNIYHVSPHETQNPDEYVTEVCYPVRKA